MSTASATVTRLPHLTREELAAVQASGYRYQAISARTASRRGLTPRVASVERLFDSLPADGGPASVWASFGHVDGVERFSTHIMRRSPEGDRVEVMRPSDGTVVVAYPLGAGRTVRTLVWSAR